MPFDDHDEVVKLQTKVDHIEDKIDKLDTKLDNLLTNCSCRLNHCKDLMGNYVRWSHMGVILLAISTVCTVLVIAI